MTFFCVLKMHHWVIALISLTIVDVSMVSNHWLHLIINEDDIIVMSIDDVNLATTQSVC